MVWRPGRRHALRHHQQQRREQEVSEKKFHSSTDGKIEPLIEWCHRPAPGADTRSGRGVPARKVGGGGRVEDAGSGFYLWGTLTLASARVSEHSPGGSATKGEL